MDPEEFIRGLVSVGLVVTMSLGASCQGASGSELGARATDAAFNEALDEARDKAPARLPQQPSGRR